MKIEQALALARTGVHVRLPVWPDGQFVYWAADTGPVVNDPLNGVRRLEFVASQLWTSEDWEAVTAPKKEGA